MVRPDPVMTSADLREPGVVGIFRPVLLFPAEIDSRLTPQQFQAILKHELCHVGRHDNLTAAIHMIVEALSGSFHPCGGSAPECSMSVNARATKRVVQSGNDARMYAEGILRVCRSYLASELPCVSGVSGANLKRDWRRS